MNAYLPSFPAEALVETGPVRVARAAPCGRLALRARGELAPFGAVLGLTLPARIGDCARSEAAQVLCLGPDEWSVHTPAERVAEIEAGFAAIYARHPHSLVDVSGRETTFLIEGPRAAELMTLGMARDPETIAAGEGRRISFDGVTVVLWRDAEDSFRLDVWHSFAPHVFDLLETGCRELAAETA